MSINSHTINYLQRYTRESTWKHLQSAWEKRRRLVSFFPLVSSSSLPRCASLCYFLDKPRRGREHFFLVCYITLLHAGRIRSCHHSVTCTRRRRDLRGMLSFVVRIQGNDICTFLHFKATKSDFRCRENCANFCACCATWSRSISLRRTTFSPTSSPSTSSIFSTDTRRKVYARRQRTKMSRKKSFVIDRFRIAHRS